MRNGTSIMQKYWFVGILALACAGAPACGVSEEGAGFDNTELLQPIGGGGGGTPTPLSPCPSVTNEAPTHDIRWTQGTDVNNDVRIFGKMIIGYQIQWFNGSWSQVYTPGKDDVDWVTNLDGTQRRVWSYFYDHTHRYFTGTDILESANSDIRWSRGTSLSLDNQIIGKDILAYRIQWFNGSWSQDYTPGLDDIDWKTNLDGTQRRVWSYFYDHTHRYAVCSKPSVAPAPLSVQSENAVRRAPGAVTAAP